GADPLALGHRAFAGLQKLEFSGRWSRVAFADSWPTKNPVRYMPHHPHVNPLALAGVTSLTFLRQILIDTIAGA
ncbi:MAG: hypothetical protein WCC64_18705, partial [Aliidongia sp.]